MSKMSELHAELSEQANELGFESLDEALANGYEVDYEEKQLVNPYVLVDKAQEEAHEAWLKKRDEVLSIIESVKEDIVELNDGDNKHVAIEELNQVIDFVEDCHD